MGQAQAQALCFPWEEDQSWLAVGECREGRAGEQPEEETFRTWGCGTRKEGLGLSRPHKSHPRPPLESGPSVPDLPLHQEIPRPACPGLPLPGAGSWGRREPGGGEAELCPALGSRNPGLTSGGEGEGVAAKKCRLTKLKLGKEATSRGAFKTLSSPYSEGSPQCGLLLPPYLHQVSLSFLPPVCWWGRGTCRSHVCLWAPQGWAGLERGCGCRSPRTCGAVSGCTLPFPLWVL